MERLQDNKRRSRRWGSYCRSSVIWRRRSRRTRVCPETPPDWALCGAVSPLLFLLVAFSLFLRQQQPRDTGFENAPTSSSERSDIECSARGRRAAEEAGGGARSALPGPAVLRMAAGGAREARSARGRGERAVGAGGALSGAERPGAARVQPGRVASSLEAAHRRPIRPTTPQLQRPRAEVTIAFPAVAAGGLKVLHASCLFLPGSRSPTVRAMSPRDPGGLAGTRSAVPHPSTTIPRGRVGTLASVPPTTVPSLLSW